ncbi:hypothetical protein F511_22810 [Dorcoceras hygrometricum]|uniref:Transcription repressor n=1 Tax=Dorcoceras hygrometricum TaxID=472368 RepID=A0A2Z7C4N8_9LAMI|nr:hypothetical protein F511_22810 [Dorcoceras hygrometricum]
MGNYKFRFSDLIPNSWFYKLKEGNKTRKNQHKHRTVPSSSPSPFAVAEPKTHLSDHRKSYHFMRDLTQSSNSPLRPRISVKQSSPVEPPRRSSRRRRSAKRDRRQQKLYTSSASADSSCRASVESAWTKGHGESVGPRDIDQQTSSSDYDSVSPEYGSDRGLTPDTFDGMLSCSTSCRCSVENDTVSEHDHLPPIITKKLQEPTKILKPSVDFPEKNAYGSLSVKVVKEDFPSTPSATSSSKDHQNKIITSPVRRHSPKVSPPGLRLRTNSPRIGNLRTQARKNTSTSSNSSSAGSRRSVAESFAVVKSSKDPRRDFRESMVEMIFENNISASKDLEELLACYLSLNSDEYHDLIINVFKQIWFEFLHVRLK